MKIKDGYIIRQVAGNYVVVAIGDEAVDFNGIITTNETGAFLWKSLSNDTTKENLLKEMLAEYDVSENVAKADIDKFLDKLTDADLLVI